MSALPIAGPLCSRCNEATAVWRGMCVACRDRLNPSAAIQDRCLMLLRDLVGRGMVPPGERHEFVCAFTADANRQIESYEVSLRTGRGDLAFRQQYASGTGPGRPASGRVARFKRWLASALMR